MKAGWQRMRLGDLCKKITDGSHNPPKGIQSSEYLMLSSKNIFDDRIILDDPRYLSEADFRIENKRTDIEAGDVLLTIVGTVGRVAVVPDNLPKFTLQRSVAVLKNKRDAISSRFLMRSLQNILDELTENARGVAQKGLYLGQIQNLEILIPPLPEQQRIVTILDQAFEGIATATANAEKNLANARELFDSTMHSIFTDKRDQWIANTSPLADLCKLIVDCEHKTAPTQAEGIPSIRTPNIGKGKLLLEGVYRVSDETYREWTRRAEPQGGDLILAREAPAGNVAVIPDNLKVCLGQRTVLIRPKKELFVPEFLALTLLQPQLQQKLLAHSRGATVQHVNMKDIRALVIEHIPPLNTQREIVAFSEELADKVEQLEAIYQQKLIALEELKKSILNQAFTGKLAADSIMRAAA